MNAITWLERAVVDAMHDRLLAEHGGRPGCRDEALLDSALARPTQLAAYGKPDLCDLAAAYADGIVRNHPFIDGNKRTAFVTAYVSLACNGLRLRAPEEQAVHTTMALAEGSIDRHTLAEWLRRHTEELSL